MGETRVAVDDCVCSAQGRRYPQMVMNKRNQGPGAHRPVFVDVSGRRRRRLRLAGAVGVLPAVLYVFLLVSTVLGGPTVTSPFLPLPPAPPPAAAGSPTLAPTAPATAAHSSPLATVAPARSTTSVTFASPVAGVVSTVPAAVPTFAPLTASPATTTPAARLTGSARATNKPTSLPSPTNRPTRKAR